MYKYRWIVVIIGVIIVTFVSQSMSHSGRTDANGGHHNRKTGGYHYHNKKTYTPPVQPQLQEAPRPILPRRRSVAKKPKTLSTIPKVASITENHW